MAAIALFFTRNEGDFPGFCPPLMKAKSNFVFTQKQALPFSESTNNKKEKKKQ
jgi:hypothetical protein